MTGKRSETRTADFYPMVDLLTGTNRS